MKSEEFTPLGLRNNNPLNIRKVPGTHWKGELPQSSSPSRGGREGSPFCHFTTLEHGIRAAYQILDTYRRKYHAVCIEDIISRSSKRKQHRGLYPLSLHAYRLWRQGKAHGNGVAGSHQGNGRRGKPNVPRRRHPENSLQSLSELKTLTTQKLTTMKKNNIWELILKVIVAAITAALTAITTTSCIGYGPF